MIHGIMSLLSKKASTGTTLMITISALLIQNNTLVEARSFVNCTNTDDDVQNIVISIVDNSFVDMDGDDVYYCHIYDCFKCGLWTFTVAFFDSDSLTVELHNGKA